MTARVSEDWRLASAEVVGGLLEAERQRWIAALHWDAQPAFDLLERTRQSGQAPGLLAYDADGRPHGFTHYYLQNRRLQIGGLVAESGEVTRQLLDDVLRTPEAELASDVLCFAFPASTALAGIDQGLADVNLAFDRVTNAQTQIGVELARLPEDRARLDTQHRAADARRSSVEDANSPSRSAR